MVSVSVIIPNYNKGVLVKHSLDSLLRQTCGDWEAIVVDDCSSDDSWAVIREYAAKDDRIVAARNETNKGGNFCRNLGAKMSHGKYLVFLDSDDWLSDDCIEYRVKEFERDENKGVDLLVFQMMATMDGVTGGIWRCGDSNNALESFLRHEIVWQTMMPIWRSTAFVRIGGFDEAFPRLQDVELHTRALLLGLKYKLAQRTTPDSFYFIDEARMTSNHEKAAENFVRAIELYHAKMSQLIKASSGVMVKKAYLLNDLVETQMTAIRIVGDLYQTGKIDKVARNQFFKRVLSICRNRDVYFYAMLYKLNVNRIKGFNFLYRRSYRLRCLALRCKER